jgi:pimeloyl-ACP methyl ester carboxylesterase
MHDIEHRMVQTNGISLHIASQGEGPLVVFCHGFPGHWSNWKHQLNAVAEAGFTGVAVDMRGYGGSSRPESIADYSMDEQIADMCGLLDSLELEKAIFVGQDFGAALVWSMALREPGRVMAVIGISIPFDHDYYGRSCLGHLSNEELLEQDLGNLLVASPVHPPSVGFDAISKQQFLHAHYFQEEGVADRELGGNPREYLTRIYWALSANGHLGDWSRFGSEGTRYLEVLPPAPALPWSWMSEHDMDVIETAYLSAGKDKAFIGGLASYRVADINWRLGKKYAAINIRVPALFVGGAADPVIEALDKGALDRMKSRIPRLKEAKILPGTGHFVQLESPEETARIIVEFIEGIT